MKCLFCFSLDLDIIQKILLPPIDADTICLNIFVFSKQTQFIGRFIYLLL